VGYNYAGDDNIYMSTGNSTEGKESHIEMSLLSLRKTVENYRLKKI
jgi:hypothetical protein